MGSEFDEAVFEDDVDGEMLVISLREGARVDQTSYEMLTGNDIEGFLKPILSQFDTDISICYNVAGLVPLESVLSEPMRKAQVLRCLNGLVKAVDISRDYLLEENSIAMDTQHVFMRVDTGNVFLVAVPIEGWRSEEDFESLLRQIIISAHVVDDASFIGVLLSCINDAKFSLDVFKQCLQGVEHDANHQRDIKPAASKAVVSWDAPPFSSRQAVPAACTPSVPTPQVQAPLPQPQQRSQPMPSAPPVSPAGFVVGEGAEANAGAPGYGLGGFPGVVIPETPGGKSKKRAKLGKSESKDKAKRQKKKAAPEKEKGIKAFSLFGGSKKKSNPEGEFEFGVVAPGMEHPVVEKARKSKIADEQRAAPVNSARNAASVEADFGVTVVYPNEEAALASAAVPAPSPSPTPSSVPTPSSAPVPVPPVDAPTSAAADDNPTSPWPDEAAGSDAPTMLGVSPQAWLRQEETGTEFEITGLVCVLGRSASKADVCVSSNKEVSKCHAKVTFDGAAYWIEDLESLNHTYVDGHQLQPGQRVQLADGSVIRLSGEKFVFHL